MMESVCKCLKLAKKYSDRHFSETHKMYIVRFVRTAAQHNDT